MILLQRVLVLSILLCSLALTISAQLSRQWVARFNGGVKNSNNVATAMVIDKFGNVIVTGWVTRKSTGIDFATVKYSSDGEKLWDVYYSGPPGSKRADKAKSIAVDSGANVYVTGSSDGGSSGLDYATVKYDSNGVQQWVNVYNGPGNGEDQPSSVAVNDSLSVFVTGWSRGVGTGFDFATVKYDSAGNQKWVMRYNGPALGTFNGTDSALAMGLRGTTGLYVHGTSGDPGYDSFTIRYNPATGDSVAAWRNNGYGLGTDIARALVLRNGSPTEIYVTGRRQETSTGGGDFDYLTFRYLATGGTDWSARYNGASNGDDDAYEIGRAA